MTTSASLRPQSAAAPLLPEAPPRRERRLRRLVRACAGAVALGLIAAPDPAGAFVPRVPESFFGVSAPSFHSMAQPGETELLEAHLAQIEGTGVGWVRDAVIWPEVEPTAPVGGTHSYKFGGLHAQIARFARHGLTMLPVIRGTPAWAASSDGVAGACGAEGGLSASGVGDYAAFVDAFMRRYGRGGAYWSAHPELSYLPVTRVELWNEPNWGSFWCPGPDPERYAQLVAAGADAAHAIDPDAVVSTGGLVALKESENRGGALYGAGVADFLTDMVAAVPALPGKVDAVGIHLYDLDPDVDISLLGWLRSKMEAAGLGAASILITEYGWRVGGGAGSVPEELRAELERAFTHQVARLNCGVIGIAPHAWVSEEEDPADTEHWWGIADPDSGAPYPTGKAYADEVALYEGRGEEAAPRRTIPVCNGPLPDQDGDGTADQDDDFPLDPTRDSGAGEVPSDPAPRPAPTFPARVGDRFFGAMTTGWPADGIGRRAQAASLQAGGIGQTRETVSWRQIEPIGPADLGSDARWSELDARFVRLAVNGVRALPTFTQPPAWANPGSPAQAEEAFAEFLEAFARRYGRGGSFWRINRHLDESQLAVRDYEIWDAGNVNQSWWDGSASAGEYASAYVRGRTALREVDPHARTLVSLDQAGQSPAGFLRDMVAVRPETAGGIDGAVLLATGARDAAAIEQVLATFRSSLDATGNPGSPIYLGFGWYVNGPGAISESTRAALYRQVADRLARSDCGLAGLLARSWVTNQLDPARQSDWYGIVDPVSFQLSPSAQAYRDVAATYLGYSADPPPQEVVPACTVDTTPPPAPRIDTAPPAFSKSTSASFTYSDAASDLASYRCKLDGGSFSTCSSSGKSYVGLAQGQHTFTVRAVDTAGLVSTDTAHTWTVDIKPPETTITSGPRGTIRAANTKFTFSTNEATGARFTCRLDAAPSQWCVTPLSLAGLFNGFHTFRVAAVDRAGNVDPTPATRLFAVKAG